MKNACAGVCIGFLLFFGSWGVLFWNEGRAVKRQQDLDEGRDLVLQVGLTQANGTIDKSFDTKLIYVTGTVDGGTSSSIIDDVFNLDVSNETQALKYAREVQMYQWQERSETRTEKTSTGGTRQVKTYYYDQAWSSTLISSTSFKESAQHVNPTSFRISPYSATSPSIALGAYSMSDLLLGEIDWWTTWFDAPVNPSELQFSGNYSKSFGAGQFQLSLNPNTVSIGDTRVTFSVVLPDSVSVVAMQNSDGTLVPYITEGDRELWLFSRGVRTSDELFQEAEDDNTQLTWILRFVGFLCMCFGVCLILNPIATAFDVLPFCGDALEGCIGGCIIPCIALVICVPMSLLIISIAWIFYRPVFAAVSIAMLVILGFIFVKYLKPKLSKPPANGGNPDGKPNNQQFGQPNQQYGQPNQQQFQEQPYQQNQPYGQAATAVPMGNQPPPYGEQEIPVSMPPPPAYGNNEPAPFGMALDNPPPQSNPGYGGNDYGNNDGYGNNNYSGGGGGYPSAPPAPPQQSYGGGGGGVYKPPA